MKRTSLYSRASKPRTASRLVGGQAVPEPVAEPVPSTAVRSRWARARAWAARHDRPLLLMVAGLLALGVVLGHAALTPEVRRLTQDDIDAAVRHSLEKEPLPSWAAKAYETIRPSVVRVREMDVDFDKGENFETGVGSGVVIVDNGIILTNLHVVADARRIGVVFFDGMESEATIIATQPEDDLAVIRAKTIPDDLAAATLRSTSDLAPGDEVVAVGFPFGIGPSASSGIISGLRREYQSQDGKRTLTNLIQFDAAVNPGNSGGPLVTSEGEVVGIVTGILNPNRQRVFIGIGFAVPIENAASAVGMSPF